MKIIKLKGGKYKAESSKKGNFYDVDINVPSCSCPQFLYRERQTGGKCKHILAVERSYGKGSKKGKNAGAKASKKGTASSQRTLKSSLRSSNRVLEEVKKKGEIETVVLMEQYGEGNVQELIDRGELIEIKGKVRVLE